MSPENTLSPRDAWPDIPYADWKDTCATLHLWTQIVGKVRLVTGPWINHYWHATFYVTARGLTTSALPYRGQRFEMEFDFIDQVLRITTSAGTSRTVALETRTVADFYDAVMSALAELGIRLRINGMPNEIPDAIPFRQDRTHSMYDPERAHRFWLALLQIDRVCGQFRAGFIGKCSPVHVFWGSLDLAVTRFSGRPAPPHPGGVPNLPDEVTRESYSHEVSSAGFWPGGGGVDEPMFYSYTYPEPQGFRTAPVRPEGAFFNEALGEFLLPYEAVRSSADPDGTLLAFLESTYEAAASAAAWDRSSLERTPV